LGSLKDAKVSYNERPACLLDLRVLEGLEDHLWSHTCRITYGDSHNGFGHLTFLL
jgi:hypothetical protein